MNPSASLFIYFYGKVLTTPRPYTRPQPTQSIKGHLAPARIHHSTQIFMDLLRSKFALIRRRHSLFDEQRIKKLLYVLEVGHIPACAQYGVLVRSMQTLNVLEARERVV